MRTITSDLFNAFSKCPLKCYRISKGEKGFGNVFADWMVEQEKSYRDENLNRLVGQNKTIQFEMGQLEKSALRHGQWQFALNCRIVDHYLESYLDAVERIALEKSQKNYSLVPIRFIRRKKVTIEDKLTVGFDASVLSGMTGRKIHFGKIIYGPEYRSLKVITARMQNKVKGQIEKIKHCLSEAKAPDLFLNRRCNDCEFQFACKKDAVEKDDLTLLASMSEKERKKLKGKGIFTVTQLSYTFRPRRRAKRSTLKNEKYHQSLKALAIRERKIHVVGKPELNIEGTPVYLDVEGLPEEEFYFLIGIRIPTNSGFVHRSFWADNNKNEKKIWNSFLGLLASIHNPTLIHYGSFETNFLKRMITRYGGPSDDGLNKAIKNSVNLLSVIYARIYFPTYSNGLKDLAEFIGFKWSEPNVSGLQAIVWRHEWEKSGKPELKQKLIKYNSEDCEGLQRVENFISNFIKPEISPEYNKIGVVNTESMTRETPFKFGKTKFLIPEFEEINRAAYWDYQREKVMVKSSRHIKDIEEKKQKKKFGKPRPNKIINWPGPSECPKCKELKIWKIQAKSKTVFDVKFITFGIKRMILNYIFYSYRCKKCGAVFQNPNRSWSGTKFGQNLLALSVYLTIDLGIPQNQVTIFLNQIFGFNFNRTVTSKFKTKAAIFYKESYEWLVRKLALGKLVHADETKVNLLTDTGTIWTFTNLEEAVYIYSQSREGDLVQSLLKDFKGVLISDFYPAYDSIVCPQQKCLVHLIRDLNDELRKEPFNEEIKEIANGFGQLLKPIIETIDRFGLKTHFLRKHKVSVHRFFKCLNKGDYKSETALKYRKRFEKNRNTLFTFLDYDNVPWNNNNGVNPKVS
jgi:predicted RecB family nuclease